MFLEWKSQDWLAKVETPRGNTTPDVQHGLNAYAKKQAAVHRHLAVSFAKLWRPTFVSYDLKHSWLTEYLTKNGVPPDETDTPALSTRGILKFRLSNESNDTIPTAAAVPSIAKATVNNSLLPEEYDFSEDSGLEDSGLEDGDLDFEDDWGDDLDF